MFNRTQNDAIWGLITLLLTNQIAGNTSDFKMNVINMIITFQNVEQQDLPVKKEIDTVKHSCQI